MGRAIEEQQLGLNAIEQVKQYSYVQVMHIQKTIYEMQVGQVENLFWDRMAEFLDSVPKGGSNTGSLFIQMKVDKATLHFLF